MKSCLFFSILTLLLSAQSLAAVKFTGGNWSFGDAEKEVLQSVGIATDEAGLTQVALNFSNFRQVILSGAHSSLGLALTDYQGKCIKIIPGRQLASVNFILSCD